MQELEVILPKKISLNPYLRMHFFPRNELNKEFYLAVKEGVQKFKTKPIKEQVNIHFTFYLKGKLLDWDNTIGMVKTIQDGLVHEGILEDDSNKFIKQGTSLVEKTKRKYNYCLIELN